MPSHYLRLEEAIADIQLFGTIKQVELAKKVAITFAKEKSIDLNELIVMLRNELRKELNLEGIREKNVTHLRIRSL